MYIKNPRFAENYVSEDQKVNHIKKWYYFIKNLLIFMFINEILNCW